MTPLRQRMLEELQRRNYSPATTRGYILAVKQFAEYFGKSPDQLGAEEVRRFQLYLLNEKKLAPGTVEMRMSALRFLYKKTLKRRDLTFDDRSKTIAERAAWAELPKLPRPLEWVAINPGLVLGPVLDKDSSASVLIVAKLLNGEIPGLPHFGYGVVDVRDLADLEVRAMTAPQAAGQRYIGSGPFISMSEIAKVLKERLGDKAKKVPTRKLPDWVVRLVGLIDSEVRGQVFELGKVRRLSSAKAEKDLGWSSRPWEDTIVDTATSLEAVGALT